MLKAVQDFFRSRMQSRGAEGGREEHALQMAAAALLFEMVRADHEAQAAEREAVERALRKTFGLSEEETRRLAEVAEQEAEDAVSLYPFTALINRHFTAHDKVRVVEALWQVAWADGHLHPWEEALVRKIAELIHVPHRDFLQAKHRAQPRHP